MAKKTYVLDTSVYLTDFNAINSYSNNDIVIPLRVLDEIDNHKQRQGSVGINARQFIRILDSLREKGNIHKGVRLGKGRGLVSVCGFDLNLLPKDLDIEIPDNQIIAAALTLIENIKNEGRNRKVILVSRDINMRVKCDAIGVLTEDYIKEKIVKSSSEVYTGFIEHLVDDQIIDKFYEGGEVLFDKQEGGFFPQQFIMLVSNSNDKKTAIGRFINYFTPLQKVRECNGGRSKSTWGIKTRNKEQSFAINLLKDPKVPIVTLIGKAGTGKTLCAIAAGLEQILEKKENSPYKHLIVSRPIQPMGKDIGYLPGSMEEKMMPWLAPIQDNLKFLLGNDQETLKMYMDQGIIEMEALTYIRGRSIANAFIIIDEAQNLTIHELKTIITRVGENTKVIFTGDIEQIDNVYVDELSNGLTYAIEKFKEHELAGHVTLLKGERSKVATLAARIL